MAPQGETRERVLRTAGELFERQGYHGTGLNQVLAESRKEQLAAEATARSGQELARTLASAALGAPDARDGVTAVGEHFARVLEESGFRKGCPVATVALETAADNEPIRAACDETYTSWQQGIAEAMRGGGVPDGKADALATLVLSSLQGALLLARVRRDATVIRTITRQLADLVGREIGT
jgi:TetR/AcrR family transcriptional repressor of lmrAB and yxaGH operons